MELYVRVTCRGQSLQSGAFRECGFDLVGATVVYEYCLIQYDGDTGKSKGYGFVCYSSKSEMETALESLMGLSWRVHHSSKPASREEILISYNSILESL